MVAGAPTATMVAGLRRRRWWLVPTATIEVGGHGVEKERWRRSGREKAFGRENVTMVAGLRWRRWWLVPTATVGVGGRGVEKERWRRSGRERRPSDERSETL